MLRQTQATLVRRAPLSPFSLALRTFSSTPRSLSTSTELQPTDPLDLYRGLVAQGKVKFDPDQVRALVQMRKIHAELLDYSPPVRLLTLLDSLRPASDPLAASTPEWPFKRSYLSNVSQDTLEAEEKERQEIIQMTDAAKTKALVTVLKGSEGLEALTTPRGFLLTGPPGTGKSLLMDIFFQSLPVPHKVRYHYHHFLLSIYSQVHDALEAQRLMNEAEEVANNASALAGGEGYPWSRREEMKALAVTKGWRAVFAGGRAATDPDLNNKEFVLATIARDLIKTHGWLLAFDEVQLVDIAGAGLINRVLSWYWRLGGVVVGTSNRVPEDLYNQGVQRNTIDGFLVALASRSPVIQVASSLDYRREQRGLVLDPKDDMEAGDYGEVEAWHRWGTASKGWFVKGEEAEFEDAVRRLVGTEPGTPKTLRVYGRNLVVPWTLGGVARFTYSDLCENALGPADYITLGSAFHTIIVTDIPILLLNAKNQARRLITLLDSLYETKTRLLISAETSVDTIFFPDAVATSSFSEKRYDPTAPDDIVTYGGSDHPFSAERIYESDQLSLPGSSRFAVDPSGEVGDVLEQPYVPPNFGMDASAEIGDVLGPSGGDSLNQEMLSELAQELEAPYRPNVSSYSDSAATAQYSKDEARFHQEKPLTVRKTVSSGKFDPHPSASVPAFQSLAIFSGEEERFAFKRAVSRVHEMSSAEFLTTALWQPLDPSMRTWERSSKATSTPRPAPRPSMAVMGAAGPLSTDKLSGVLSPSDLRVKQKVVQGREIDVSKKVKQDVLSMENPRQETSPPELKSDHVWGVREDWGKGAGTWGKGASVHEKPEKV